MEIIKVFYLLLFSALQLLEVAKSDPPREVSLRKLSRYIMIDVRCKLMKSYLANKHLPVWIIDEEKPKNLIPLKNIMNDIGPIHMYQDLKKCAAAVYFEKGQYFDGMVDQGYAIKNYNPKIDSELEEGINLFPPSILIHPVYDNDRDDNISPDHVEFSYGKNWRYVKSRVEDPNVVYVEILVVVNYDVATSYGNDYKALVSEMLVTFNSVDMIYGKINKPKIKINIAGIIIGNGRNSFPVVEQYCYQQLENTGEVVLDVECVHKALTFDLESDQNIIHMNSFDVIVFLTKSRICYFTKDANGKEVPSFVYGFAGRDFHDDYIGHVTTAEDIRICTVQHFDYSQHFSVIAHELAHLFEVTHDPGEFRSSNKECIANLMRMGGSLCEKCLYFADTSIKQMKRFFRSREGCRFRNEPHSLYGPSKPQLFWNEHKQCQCYGYVMAKKPQEINCGYERPLKCLDGAENVMETDYFMDGTLCNNHESDKKVCWYGKCKHLIN